MFITSDVILVDFLGAQGIKLRPGIVVSSDAYNRARPDVIVALCTSNLRSATTAMDYQLADWKAAGLRVPTAYRSYFATIAVSNVHRRFGHLSDRDWQEVQARLRLAIAVS